jgi:MoaA/NifB/PqqE/SkfB family radical SAM enzyme
MLIPAIDIYVTYRCNMRCKHCFVGDLLDSAQDFPWPSLKELIEQAGEQWGTTELVYLGGEPTLYPHLSQAIEHSQRAGYRVRVVSNGGRSLRRLVQGDLSEFSISVSLDASNSYGHDRIRNKGAFRNALEAIREARARGHAISAILSVGSHNLSDALDTLELLAALGVDSVSVHYVSNRGFADKTMPIGVSSWLEFRKRVIERRLPVVVRFERTFQAGNEASRCAVRDNSMLMFFPDGRVFQCSLFLGLPNGHTYTWSGSELRDNHDFGQLYKAALRSNIHCPAMRHLNPDLCELAAAENLEVGCIFDKEVMPAAEATSDNHPDKRMTDVGTQAP